MKEMTKEHYRKMTNIYIFFDIRHFITEVAWEMISKYDGNGNYVYIDKDCKLYVDEDNGIDFEELEKYNHNINKIIEEKSKEYRLIGVFWHNK